MPTVYLNVIALISFIFLLMYFCLLLELGPEIKKDQVQNGRGADAEIDIVFQ
jgi:hypothetical protein